MSATTASDPGDTENDLAHQYPTPAPDPSTSTSFTALKARIRHHYELASDYYYSLWGEHIHHGYFLHPDDTKETAQTRLIDLLIERAGGLEHGSRVLDVGCGIGGTARYLACKHGCHVTGVTISGKQVEMATRISREQHAAGVDEPKAGGDHAAVIKVQEGTVRFLELDADEMGTYFSSPAQDDTFTCVWIAEAMSHLPNKALFFANAFKLLRPGGKLAIADWFQAEDLTAQQLEADIKPIEDGMLLPPLSTPTHYLSLARSAGFEPSSSSSPPSLDISANVAKTWQISWSLVQNPALWAFALSQGRDGIAFLQAFRAMRRGYANGTFRYAVMAFRKPS